MKKHKLASLIFVFLLFGCSSVQPEPMPTLIPIPTNTPRPTEALNVLPTPKNLSEWAASEITTTFKDNQIVIKGFQPTIIRWLYWLKDGEILLIGTQENGVTIYDVANKKATMNFENSRVIQDLALSPDEKTLAVVIYAADSIRLIDPETGNLIKTFYIPDYWPGEPGGLAFSPDSKMLASINHKDREIILWDVADGKEITRLFTNDEWIGRLSFSPDGKSLMASSWYTTFRVWDTNTWKLQRTFGGDNAKTGKRLLELAMGYYARAIALAFSPDGTKLASVSQNDNTGEVIIWDINQP